MVKNIMKKSILVMFIVISMLFVFGLINQNETLAFDYQQSSAWHGEGLDFTPQTQIDYDSQYRQFKDIIDHPELISIEKSYVIEDAYDLFMLSKRALETNRLQYLSLNYILGNDIDYYEIVQKNITQRFHPIGFIEPFTGTFDGQGFEITNLYFNSILSEDTYQTTYSGLRYLSMFSKVSSTGVVKNLGLINPIIIQPISFGIMDHVSTFIGENYGLLKNVYVIDDRKEASGISAEGDFHISGLVSINHGIISNSLLSTQYIRSRAVLENTSTNILVHENYGTLTNLYYDQSIYDDASTSFTYGTGLTTEEFQNPLHFSNDWFFNDHYHTLATHPNQLPQLTLNNVYPQLQALRSSGGKIELYDALDVIHMNELFNISGMFRSAHYVVKHDIDMSQVSIDAYEAAQIGFSGMISSDVVTAESILYPRHIEQGGDTLYHTILNLKIYHATSIGNFASYAFFASFFGVIENINFANMDVKTIDLDAHVEKTKVLVSTLVGQSNSGSITNVHVHSELLITQSELATTKLYVGGMIGEGSGTLIDISTNGSIVHDLQLDGPLSHHSATGGIIGYADHIDMSRVYAAMDITGLGYVTINNHTLYLGGVVGTGSLTSLHQIVQSGRIVSHLDTGYVQTLFIGGIIGLETNQKDSVSQIYNQGNIDVNMTNPMQVSLAGFGSIDGQNQEEDAIFTYYSLTNSGLLRLVHPYGNTFSLVELSQMDITVSGVVNADYIDGSFYGLFNESHITLDLSLIKEVAGIITIKNSLETTIDHTSNTGQITLTTENQLVQERVKISGNIIGTNITMDHLRNDGNISVIFNHDTSISSGNLYAYGLFEEVSQDMSARNGFNGGDISLTINQATIINYQLYIAGIGYKHANTHHVINAHIDYDSIENITDQIGSIDQMLNTGDLQIVGAYQKHSKIAGIVVINAGLITSSINLGNIKNYNDVQFADQEVGSAGIVYLMLGQYAQVKDVANYGNVESVSITTHGYTHASGIVLRNDQLENGQSLDLTTKSQYAKILFSINYGDIYAYNGTDESIAYQIASETRSKASGVFTIGLLSLVNAINYGNIYSRYLASGMIGFIDFTKFLTYGPDQVYLANTINYGKIREITSFDGTYHIDMLVKPIRTSYNAYGSTIGKFHTGTSTWEFLSMSSLALFPIDWISFGYMINFDQVSDMIGNAPEITLEASLATNGVGNDVLLLMIGTFFTVNPDDDSKEPFTLFFIEVSPKGSYYGKDIDTYTISENYDGIFSSEFVFRALPTSYSGTNQYLKNYFSYVSKDKTNTTLIDRLEQDSIVDFPGIYVLSSSSSIDNGIFIPDHFDLTELYPILLNQEPDPTWLGQLTDPDSIIYKMTYGMRQIMATYATTVYDLEIMQVDAFGMPIENGLTLNMPSIDEERGLITYYLPSNASILNTTTSQSLLTYSFVEVSEGIGRKVPNVYDNGAWTYKWVGNYKKDENQYLPIGPYHSTGNMDVEFNISSNNDKSKQNNDVIPNTTYVRQDISSDGSIRNEIHTHLPHIKQVVNDNFWWEQTGLYVNSATLVSAGYGPYKVYNYQQPPLYSVVYQYAGANEDLVTYEKTDPTTTTIFTDALVYFSVNLDEGRYTIAQGASLYDEGMSNVSTITVPKSFGVYDVLMDATLDTYIDSVTDHYGSVRVFSQEYDAIDPATYRDYDIRIIRTADQSLLDIEQLFINGNDALPAYTDFRDITANQALFYTSTDDLGLMSISYSTSNIANNYHVLSLVALYDNATGELVDTSLYKLHKGYVINPNVFNNINGTWGDGQVTIDFEVTDYLPSGSYRFELTLVTSEVVKIYVDKIESSNALITKLIYSGVEVEAEFNDYHSVIPYGIYYDAMDITTEKVNFSNLDTISSLYYIDLTAESIPNYLDELMISPFSTLISTTLSITTVTESRYQYQIQYTIQAEDGTLSIFNHYLTEDLLSSFSTHIYKNGGEVYLPVDVIEIEYLSAPTIRVEFKLDRLYLPRQDLLVISTAFLPDEPLDEAFEDVDYFVDNLFAIGYEVNFNQNIALGIYTLTYTYVSSQQLWGESLAWTFAFETIDIQKIRNDDSHLENILFVSETIFSGFDTIVDISTIDNESYTYYYENPNERLMTVLPSTGIYYGDYANAQTYWIVGQVQKTNLIHYLPTFDIPDGAMIKRVVDFEQESYLYQSDYLAADFSPFGDTFNFVLYRVYAHDYDTDSSHYTNYYVAIQDMTNNILLNLSVINQTDHHLSDVFISMHVCQLGVDYVSSCSIADTLLSMSVFSTYKPTLGTFENNKLKATMYGTYYLHIALPSHLTYQVTVQDILIETEGFYLESSLLPRRYYVVVTIIDKIVSDPWGKNTINTDLVEAAPIDVLKTYIAGELFLFDDTVWMVQQGYTYLYNAFSQPGDSSDLGLLDIDGIFNPYSTFVIGDAVYYQGSYYQANTVNASGTIPSAQSILDGDWIALP